MQSSVQQRSFSRTTNFVYDPCYADIVTDTAQQALKQLSAKKRIQKSQQKTIYHGTVQGVPVFIKSFPLE